MKKGVGKKSKIKFDDTPKVSHSLKKGIITNLTNPNMYLYWGLIGAPFLLDAYSTNKTYPFSDFSQLTVPLSSGYYLTNY